MSVLRHAAFVLLSLAIAAGLAWFGFALSADRNGVASRGAARWAFWRLDLPAEDQPVRRRQTFEQALLGRRWMGVLLVVMGGSVVLLAGIGLFNHS
jgi:hypothetical protein